MSSLSSPHYRRLALRRKHGCHKTRGTATAPLLQGFGVFVNGPVNCAFKAWTTLDKDAIAVTISVTRWGKLGDEVPDFAFETDIGNNPAIGVRVNARHVARVG